MKTLNIPYTLGYEIKPDEEDLKPSYDHILDKSGEVILRLASLEEGLPEEIVRRINSYEELIRSLKHVTIVTDSHYHMSVIQSHLAD